VGPAGPAGCVQSVREVGSPAWPWSSRSRRRGASARSRPSGPAGSVRRRRCPRTTGFFPCWEPPDPFFSLMTPPWQGFCSILYNDRTPGAGYCQTHATTKPPDELGRNVASLPSW